MSHSMDERCHRPGCTGTIVEGICEDCGRPPVGKSLLNAPLGHSNTSSSPLSSASLASGSSGSVGSGRTGSGRSSRTGSRASTRRQLGAGLVTLPPVASLDPLKSLMDDPVVPERKRFCNNCNAKLNHEKGFCPMCGHEYSFRPTLQPGDVVAGQYEVKGAMAYGGLGWIYLGWDKMLSRWLVLKGLLNSKDEASAAAAVAERQFLAAVKHPKIVGIYNFVNYGTEGYIVMEYVGGKTLKAIRQEHGGPLPPEEAIAYIYAILPAFSYLEKMGMIYSDFKPDNFMLEDDDVKLIDMGGVRRADDMDGDIYGTKGYSAPEANENPSYVSDLYTVGRTLAVLLMDFKFQGTHEFTLPSPSEQPLLAEQPSLYHFLLRATHQDPDERFQSADEMAEQLLGVLREIVAAKSTPRPYDSTIFSGDTMAEPTLNADGLPDGDPRTLPALKLDPLDPAANVIASASTLTGLTRKMLYQKAVKQLPDSVEAPLRLAEWHIGQGEFVEADKLLAGVEAKDRFDWRVHWYRGRSFLAQNRPQEAHGEFDRVYNEMPGELAPKLALALADERMGDLKMAARLYDLVSRVDPAFTSASFGLARCLAQQGDRSGAAAAYERVPQASSFYSEAQMALAKVMMQSLHGVPGVTDLVRASKAIQALALDGFALHHLSARLLLTAVEQVEARAITPGADQILGQALEAASLRVGAERELRACARYASTLEEKIAFVDQANQARPRTLV